MLTLEHFASLQAAHPDASRAQVRDFTLGKHSFEFSKQPSLMGVVNLSADSWYRESVCLNADMAIERGRVLKAQGAQIIDVGAESSLAHAARVDDAAQKSQLLPVVKTLSEEGILVSVETYHPTVTEACLKAGAKVLNLTGVVGSESMFRMVAEHEAAVIICFVQGQNVREVNDLRLEEDPIPMLYEFFARQTELAAKSGVNRVFIDPGLGFYYRNLGDSATRVRHQMKVFLNSFRLRTLGYPVCHALPHAFEYFGDEVRCAEPYFAVLAALGKTDLFRTHEVSKTRAVLRTMGIYQ